MRDPANEVREQAFKPRRRVLIGAAAGDHVERGTLVRRQKTLPEWWVVRFDTGAALSVHESMIRAARP